MRRLTSSLALFVEGTFTRPFVVVEITRFVRIALRQCNIEAVRHRHEFNNERLGAMKAKETASEFITENGKRFPFRNSFEHLLQEKAIRQGLPPLQDLFAVVKSWPIDGDDIASVMQQNGFVVDGDKWTPAVQEHTDHYSRGDVVYPFATPAQKVVAHDLAHAGCPPLDFSEYPVGEWYDLLFVFPDDARRVLWLSNLTPRLLSVLVKQLEEQHGKPRVNICGNTFLSEIEEC